MKEHQKLIKEFEEQKKKKIKNVKKAIAVTMAGAVVTTGVAIGSLINDNKENTKFRKNDNYVTQINNDNLPTKKTAINPPQIELLSYNGVEYYTMNTEYVLKTAKESLIRIEKLLKDNVEGLTPVAGTSGNFYPDYYNEYMLAGIAYTESSYRICTKDKLPLTSKDGALGPMQILPTTVDYVNYWLNDVMEIKDISFSTKDLIDPAKSMDIANLYLISCAKNYAKPTSRNSLFKYLNEDFSRARQQELIIAIYNEGPKNMLDHAQNGNIYDYLKEGSKQNYLNTVLKNANNIKQNHMQYLK